VSTTGQWEDLFDSRKWRVAEEVTATATVDGIRVILTRGEFEIDPPGAFRSPLSTNLGRRGVVLQETGPDGSADIPGSRVAIGLHALRRARSAYGAVW
jgi:hypothetical protein